VTGGRINVHELRAVGCAWVTETQLVALLDAVEAAHAAVTEARAGNPFTGYALDALVDNLARFDFEAGDAPK
jgi:hypothetical protein